LPTTDTSEVVITWRLRSVDFEGRWGWTQLATDHGPELHRLMTEYESTPLRKLHRDERIKEIPVKHLCRDAKSRLKELDHEDVDSLFELRLGKERWRIWGLLEQSVFLPVWWDPEHTVCPGASRRGSR
jgi:hypothetical protein